MQLESGVKQKLLPSLYEKCEEGIDFLRAFTVLQKANKSSSTKLKLKLSKREKKYLTRKSNMSTRSDCFLLPFEVFWKNKWILLEELEEIFGKQKAEPMTYSTIRYLKNNRVCHESRSLGNYLLKVRCMNNCRSLFWIFSWALWLLIFFFFFLVYHFYWRNNEHSGEVKTTSSISFPFFVKFTVIIGD